jgi:hypothetical protein
MFVLDIGEKICRNVHFSIRKGTLAFPKTRKLSGVQVWTAHQVNVLEAISVHDALQPVSVSSTDCGGAAVNKIDLYTVLLVFIEP